MYIELTVCIEYIYIYMYLYVYIYIVATCSNMSTDIYTSNRQQRQQASGNKAAGNGGNKHQASQQ